MTLAKEKVSSMGLNRQTVVNEAGSHAAAGSIEARCIARNLRTVVGVMRRMMQDGRIDAGEFRALFGLVVFVERQASAADVAADLSATASNECEIADGRLFVLLQQDLDTLTPADIEQLIRQALYTPISGDTRQEAEYARARAAQLLVLNDYRQVQRDQPIAPDAA
jgi:hypothetical protein